MTKALSQDLRDRIVAAIDNGLSCRGAAARFGVSVSSAVRWRKPAGEHVRAIARKPGGGERSTRFDKHASVPLSLLEEHGEMTLRETRSELSWWNISVAISTLWRFFKCHGIKCKKKTGHASEQGRPDFLKQRQSWLNSQSNLDPERFVFIDETWSATNMAHSHGRCARRKRLRIGLPQSHHAGRLPANGRHNRYDGA